MSCFPGNMWKAYRFQKEKKYEKNSMWKKLKRKIFKSIHCGVCTNCSSSLPKQMAEYLTTPGPYGKSYLVKQYKI